jgi:hypothetical protein
MICRRQIAQQQASWLVRLFIKKGTNLLIICKAQSEIVDVHTGTAGNRGILITCFHPAQINNFMNQSFPVRAPTQNNISPGKFSTSSVQII